MVSSSKAPEMIVKLSRLTMLVLCLLFWIAIPAFGLDTDVYKTNLSPNVAILFDTSGSMGFGVYESSVNYGRFYNYRSEQGDYDVINHDSGGTNNTYYAENGPGTPPQLPTNEILLIKGNVGVTITESGVSYTGDAGDPDYIWYSDQSSVVHTYTFIDADGNLSGDGTHEQRITLDSEGYLLLDGSLLPLDRSIKLHDWQSNPDGSSIDKGFGGQINAPGWYFSGFEGVNAESHNVADNGDKDIYFFITGNWINMQMMYNLYTINSKNEDYRTWKTTTLPDEGGDLWKTVNHEIKSPNYPSNYPKNQNKSWPVTQLDASKVKIHFTDFRTKNSSDYVKIFKKNTNNANRLYTLYGNLGSDFWKGPFDLTSNHKFIVTFHSNRRGQQRGFKIDKYKYLEAGVAETGYKMQRRIDVVREAILHVIDATRGKINWALASFSTNPTGDGAKILQPFNPSFSDDAVRENIITHINALEPDGGTPLGEALQDIYKHFAQKKNILPECSRNYTITISDGFPSADTGWSRISGKTFTDADSDGWTADPYQYHPAPANYFDDVASYLYNYSFRDQSSISSPSASYDNITCHMLSFIQGLPLLEDAALDGGGIYLAAYNKQQLINAFYSLGLMIIKSSSYVAPVISVDTSNKTQSGDMLYMAFFKPTIDRWSGNLKKYKLINKIKSNCASRSNKEWVVTDKNGIDAVDCEGTFLESSISFWSTDSDGGEVEKGGVGALLKAAVAGSSLTSSPYTSTGRSIYVLKNDGTKVQLLPNNFTNADLDVSDDATRYKVINYMYGYTFEEDGSSNHYPVARRNWPLGSIIHSTPVIAHYEKESPPKIYIVIGSNDGMLHVFKDADGSEVVAYIPENLLTRLKDLDPADLANHPSPMFYVDGPSTYYYTFDNSSTDSGKITPQQIIFGERRGGHTYYSLDITDPDPLNWTKKWYINNSMADFSEMGQSWSKMELVKFRDAGTTPKTIAVFGGGYDNTGTDRNDPVGDDSQGRGIYFIDISKAETSADFLVKSFTYSSTSGDPTNDMNFAIPCEPLLLTDCYGNFSGTYFSDLGGQVWHIGYGYNDTSSAWEWSAPRRVFTANNGSNANSGSTGGTLQNSDKGRKMFYAPAATYMGDCNYIDTSGDGGSCVSACETTGTKCEDRNYETIMLIVGTGDREEPMETSIHNRIYGIVDDSTAVIDETDLLNVTDDELDVDSTLTDTQRATLFCTLSETLGWYIKLDEISDSNDHSGEKVLSQPLIFFGKSFITTFAPNTTDPCHPHGEGKSYGLNYCNGTAGLNYDKDNDDTDGTKKYDKNDRYRVIGEAIPSSPEIVIRDGVVAAFSSVGGGLPGLGEDGSSLIPQPKFAVELINWRTLKGN